MRPAPASESALNTYRKLAHMIHARNVGDEGPGYATCVSTLRDTLFRLANQYRAHAEVRQYVGEMEELLMATHYQHMLLSAKTYGLHDLAAKCAITLLKYPFVVPQDKAFYQAGMMCRDTKDKNLAFMLLNR